MTVSRPAERRLERAVGVPVRARSGGNSGCYSGRMKTCPRLRASAALIAWVLAVPALGAVEIDDIGGRYQLSAAGETQRSVMNAMAEHFEFEVVYPDEGWGDATRDFHRRGTLDDLLDHVLAGTNYVARYWRPDENAAAAVTRV